MDKELVSVVRAPEFLVPMDKYHPPLLIDIKFPRLRRVSSPSAKSASFQSYASREWNFHKADFCKLYIAIHGIDWSELYYENDIDLATDLFYTKLNSCLDENVPVKSNLKKEGTYNYPSWYTRDIIKYIKYKYFHFKKFKEFGMLFNEELYKYYRGLVKDLIKTAYTNHLHKTQAQILVDPSKFWQYIKNKRQDRPALREFEWKGRNVTGQEAADAFADFFGSVFHANEPNLNAHVAQAEAVSGGLVSSTVTIEQLGPSDIRKAFRRLKPRSSAGPDQVPTYVVKDCRAAFEQPLLYLFNLSLQSSAYPSCWKVSKVTPVPKSGSSTSVDMYRPIAVPSVFGKMFESILDNEIRRQVDTYLADSQHGFRAARSTVTNHINFVDCVSSSMDAGFQVDATYFDFKKAFDLVDNDILLIKLAIMGFVPKLLAFLANYLKDRRQYVCIQRFMSQPYYTRSGVSQGSTLGPTLFLLMINDLPSVIKYSECLLFADDLKLYTPIRKLEDCWIHQRDIDLVAEWSISNRLSFNSSKCKTITFTRRRYPTMYSYSLSGVTLERVDTIRDLGLVMDAKLNFNAHIQSTCKQACKILGFVMRVTWDFPDLRAALLLYNAYVRSRLEFGAIVWDPHEDKYRMMVERVQRKFARYSYKRMYGYYPYLYPSQFVAGMVGMDTLHSRRKLLQLTHYVMLLRGRVNNRSVLQQMGLAVPRWHMVGISGTTGPRRQPALFARLSAYRTKSGMSAPTPRALALLNQFIFATDADVFFDNIAKLHQLLILFCNYDNF